MQTSGRTNLSRQTWRKRRGIAFLAVSLIIYAASPLFFGAISSDLRILSFLFSSWAVCIALTFLGAMIGTKPKKEVNEASSASSKGQD